MKRLILILVILFLFPFLSSPLNLNAEKLKKPIISNSNSIRPHIKLGNDYLKRGDKLKAIEEFYKIIRIDPTNIGWYRRIGNIYYDLGQKKKAVKVWEEGVKAGKKYTENSKTPSTSSSEFDKVANRIFLSFLYDRLGIAYAEMGRMMDAIKAFKEEIRLSPSGRSYFNLGYAFDKNGDCEDAIIYLELASKVYKKEYIEKLENWDKEMLDIIESYGMNDPSEFISPSDPGIYNPLESYEEGIVSLQEELERIRHERKKTRAFTKKYLRNLYSKCGYQPEDFNISKD